MIQDWLDLIFCTAAGLMGLYGLYGTYLLWHGWRRRRVLRRRLRRLVGKPYGILRFKGEVRPWKTWKSAF